MAVSAFILPWLDALWTGDPPNEGQTGILNTWRIWTTRGTAAALYARRVHPSSSASRCRLPSPQQAIEMYS